MRSPDQRSAALTLVESGLTDVEVARRLGIPRSTVRDWRRAKPRTGPACPRCWRAIRPVCLAPADYAELLGLYLGDGCIADAGRTFRLRLSLDARYPRIVTEAESLLARCFPSSRVARVGADRGSTVVLSVYHSHLPCVLPQHGPGKKHLRRIVLEPWQTEVVEAHPWAFLRGCIRSDGCAFVNRTGRYAYLSYEFRNLSADILDLFTAAAAQAGVETRRYATRVRVYRRASVALLLEHVGVKE